MMEDGDYFWSFLFLFFEQRSWTLFFQSPLNFSSNGLSSNIKMFCRGGPAVEPANYGGWLEWKAVRLWDQTDISVFKCRAHCLPAVWPRVGHLSPWTGYDRVCGPLSPPRHLLPGIRWCNHLHLKTLYHIYSFLECQCKLFNDFRPW